MYSLFTTLRTLLKRGLPAIALAVLQAGCISEDTGVCPPPDVPSVPVPPPPVPSAPAVYRIAFEYTNHAGEPADRFCADVSRMDLFVFDDRARFVKCVSRTGAPFPAGFCIEPELPAGRYTLVAWGNLSDDVTVSPRLVEGVTTLGEATVALAREGNYRDSEMKYPLFHAIREAQVDTTADRTDLLPLIKDCKRIRVTVKWVDTGNDDEEMPCSHRPAGNVRVRIADPKGAALYFDNAVAPSGGELVFGSILNEVNREGNALSSSFCLMRLVKGEKLALLVERQEAGGVPEVLYQADLVELITSHPSAGTQELLDRLDTFDNIEVKLKDDAVRGDTYMQTAVTIENWTIVVQDAHI